MTDITRYKDFTWVMDSSRSSWQTEPLHWTWIEPKTGHVLHDSPLIVHDLLYSYSATSNVITSSATSFCWRVPLHGHLPFGCPWFCNAESCKTNLSFLLFHSLCSLLKYRSCCYDVQFFDFITDDKSAGCDLWNAWWDPSERKVGETATSLQPEGNAEAQPSNSSIWSLRSQHDWSKENRKCIMWYHVILISNDWCQRNYGCLDLDHSFSYFPYCILGFVHTFYNVHINIYI